MNSLNSLLVEKYRPKTLKDIVLSPANRRYFENIANKQAIPHLLFAGRPGIGKTTLAKILVKDVLNCQYIYINASEESGVDVIRNKVTSFAQTMSLDGKLKVIILDEVDGMSRDTGGTSAQKALRNVVEEYANTCRFIMTCNYNRMVIDALQSRCQEFDLTPPFEEVVKRMVSILKQENVTVAEEDKGKFVNLIKAYFPDVRKILGNIDKRIFDGKLIIDEVSQNYEFADKVLGKIINHNSINIRKYILENCIDFNNDYHQLLKGMFEAIYNKDIPFEKKSRALLIVSNAMLQHQQVMDQEINAYTCMLELIDLKL